MPKGTRKGFNRSLVIRRWPKEKDFQESVDLSNDEEHLEKSSIDDNGSINLSNVSTLNDINDLLHFAWKISAIVLSVS